EIVGLNCGGASGRGGSERDWRANGVHARGISVDVPGLRAQGGGGRRGKDGKRRPRRRRIGGQVGRWWSGDGRALSRGRWPGAGTLSPMRVQNLIEAMERIAPARYAEPWDNVGLLVGDPEAALKGPVVLT